jgi:hypothetical protein
VIAVNPMPNELAMAHEGRIGWINGCTSQLEVDALVTAETINRGFTTGDVPKLQKLALIVGACLWKCRKLPMPRGLFPIFPARRTAAHKR